MTIILTIGRILAHWLRKLGDCGDPMWFFLRSLQVSRCFTTPLLPRTQHLRYIQQGWLCCGSCYKNPYRNSKYPQGAYRLSDRLGADMLGRAMRRANRPRPWMPRLAVATALLRPSSRRSRTVRPVNTIVIICLFAPLLLLLKLG